MVDLSRLFRAAAVLALISVAALPPLAAQDRAVFLSTIEDVPVMPGLAEDVGAGIVFDSADGRIAQAFASGSVSEAETLRFYGETLPQLGWREGKPGVYQREGEILTIEYLAPAAVGAPPTVRFQLSPSKP